MNFFLYLSLFYVGINILFNHTINSLLQENRGPVTFDEMPVEKYYNTIYQEGFGREGKYV
jgi:hypothetical protein